MGCAQIRAVLAVVVVVVVVVAMGASGQSSVPSCAQKLVPCADYINSTNPPKSCCDPLRDAVTNDLACLCNLYNTPGLLASLNFNITQALLLPGRCHIPGDLNSCLKASAPSPTSSTAGSPPATPGKDNNGVGRIRWTGMSAILILFWTCVMVS